MRNPREASDALEKNAIELSPREINEIYDEIAITEDSEIRVALYEKIFNSQIMWLLKVCHQLLATFPVVKRNLPNFEDVLWVGILKAHEAIHEYKKERGSLANYVKTAIRNGLIDHIKRDKERMVAKLDAIQEESEKLPDSVNLVEMVFNKERDEKRRNKLLELLEGGLYKAGLSEIEASRFWRFAKGKSVWVIAGEDNVTAQAVHISIYQGAIPKLQRYFKREAGELIGE